jgi:hypothetical protein
VRDDLTADHDPFAVTDEVGLGHLADPIAGFAQRGGYERLGAALAVGPANQGPTDARMRISQPLQQCAGAAEPQPNAKSTAGLESRQDVAIARILIPIECRQMSSSSS